MADRYWCAKNATGGFYAQTLNYYRANCIKEFDAMWIDGYGKKVRRRGDVKIARVEIREVQQPIGISEKEADHG